VKIALLSFEYPPETGFGGIGTYTWYQARALAKLGHEVHVLAGATTANGVAASEHDGVDVFRFRSTGALTRSLGVLDRGRLHWTRNRIENGLSMGALLRRLERRHRYDVIEMPECGAEGLLVSRLRKRNVVVRLHSPAELIMPFYDVSRADVALCSAVERWSVRAAASFSACSSFLAREARVRLRLRPPIRVIPNGIDVELFDRGPESDLRRELGIPSGRPVVLFSGRMESRKGVHVAKEIAARVMERHDVAFVFAGQDLFGYLERTLLPHLASLPLRGSVHYAGRLDLAGVRACVRQCDVFLLPSLWENCPYSCLEAMAAGRAIVATDQGGVPELIRHGESGLLARSGDPASYVGAVERLLMDAAERERLGAAARRTVETSFRDVAVATRSLELYRERLERAG
jgi:glycosyltransferase involved in cell wall biosynthesis